MLYREMIKMYGKKTVKVINTISENSEMYVKKWAVIQDRASIIEQLTRLKTKSLENLMIEILFKYPKIGREINTFNDNQIFKITKLTNEIL